MNYGLILRTVRHLKPTQVWHQVVNRAVRRRFKPVAAPDGVLPCRLAEFPAKPVSRVEDGRYDFLNLEHAPADWNDASLGMLWAYNLNYMDYLLQPDMDAADGLELITRFIDELPTNRVGLDPYPIALRSINWVKWLALNGDALDDDTRRRIHDSLYAQLLHLARRPEYHLLGNHLLEDAYALAIGAIYFSDSELWRKADRLLRRQLDEQILADGAHYEQSPMYHCILLDRLLDVYNISVNNPRLGDSQRALNTFLADKARLMLGHLDSITYAGGEEFPLFNDSALGIAPSPSEIRDYARRLGLDWEPVPLGACGYRHLAEGRVEAFVDAGAITATYQPGHTHADSLSYELRIDGRPFVVDTGISTYDKTPRRQHERGTAAHNTVTVGGRDTSEVWGGFRVGRRARVTIDKDGTNNLTATCRADGFTHTRRLYTGHGCSLFVDDSLSPAVEAVSRIHLAPGVEVRSVAKDRIETSVAAIVIVGATDVAVEPARVSSRYNRFDDSACVAITFCGRLSYVIISNHQ